jgi:hypothetical protein
MTLRQAQGERMLAPSPARRRPFVVPVDDVRWCAALAEALSVCCSGPSAARVGEVRALIASPPVEMLTCAWGDLVAAAERWLARVTMAEVHGLSRPSFEGSRLIEAALRDMPVPVPKWAERYP